ncbi:hypothetical protein H311_04008 [Anncaliia algerae PRA109]|nr:hypothetical protein H311_04008 [Anncaliia algerae PRA109]
MSDPQGYYAALGVEPTATDDEINTAYKKLIRIWHPDAGTEVRKLRDMEDSPEKEKLKEEIVNKCKKINEAKTILLDPQQRQAYDQPQSEMFDIFDFFGRSRGHKQRDEIHRIQITFEESYVGKDYKLNLTRKKKCNSCNATGGTDISKCNTCRGTGKIKREKHSSFFVTIDETNCTKCTNGEIIKNKCKECNGNKYNSENYVKDIYIPPGTEHNDKFVMKNDENKNVIIKIEVIPSDKYFRIKNHLIIKEIVDLYEVLGGGYIYVKLFNKRIKIKLNKVKDLDKCIRVKGLGFKKGDLFIQPSYKFNSSKENDKIILNRMNKDEECKETYQSDYSDIPAEEEDVRSSFFSGFFGL